MPTRRTDLPNGLTVVTEHVPAARSATFACWVRVGSRDEPAELAGVSHFLEHLLFKGTGRRTGREISEAIESVGGEMNAHTGAEATAFHTRVPASAADLGLELLVDVVSDPAFGPDDVESERQVILEELGQAEDDGGDRVHVLLQEALWRGHPLGREVLGSVASISSMTHDRIRDFHRRRYRPADLFLVAAGAVDHEAVVEAGRRLDRVVAGASVREVPSAPGAPDVAVLERPLEQVHLAFGWPARAITHADHPAQMVLNQILGGGLSSRMFQEIRERRGLAYSVYSSVEAHTDTGALIAYAGTGPTRLAEVADLVVDLARDIADRGVDEREWAVARGYLEGALLLGLEDGGAVAARLGHQLCSRGEIVPVEEQLDRIREVTVDDVHRLAAEMLTGDPFVRAVGPTTAGVLTR